MKTPELKIRTTHKTHGRHREHVEVVSLVDYPEQKGWFVQMLHKVAEASDLTPVQAKNAHALKVCVVRATALPGWKAVAALQAHQLDCKQLIGFFHSIEKALLDKNSPKTAYAHAGAFRKYVRDFLIAQKDCPQARILFKRFRSQLTIGISTGRTSISDMPDHGSNLPQLSATPHRNHADLVAKGIKKREDTRDRILTACKSEIEMFETRRAELLAAECEDVDPARMAYLSSLISHEHPKDGTVINDMPPLELYGAWAKHIRSNIRYRQPEARRLTSFVGSLPMLKHFRRLLGIRIHFWGVYYYAEFGNTYLLTICLQVLQFATGWNVDSVQSLSERDIVFRDDGSIQIQSSKARIDGDTPPCDLDQKDKLEIWVLKFLLERRSAMLRENIPVTDSLFSSPHSLGPLTSSHKELRVFQRRHNLPLYSFEQIRKEVLGYIHSTRGLEAARRTAGHADISETGIYIDQQIESEQNAAVNFEFENRLEKDIRACIVDKAASRKWPSLTPIGDGASCIDPTLPPVGSWLKGERCDAEKCHSHKCSNRRIEVNRERMLEAAHTEVFYEVRWTTLMDRNREHFDRFHLPKLLFNKALASILLQGPYGRKYSQIRSDVRNQCG